MLSEVPKTSFSSKNKPEISLIVVVLRPGFGPGSPTRKAGILNRAILPEPP